MILRLMVGASAAFAWLALPCAADVVVLCNRTKRPIDVVAEPSEGVGSQVKIPADASRPLFYSGSLSVRVRQGAQEESFHPSPGRAYSVAIDPDNQRLGLKQIRLGERSPPVKLPKPPATYAEPATIRVKLLLDEDEPTRRDVWEPRLRKRLAEASEVFSAHAGIRLEVVSVDSWESDDRTLDFYRTLREFEREVDPKPADIAIGFSSQYRVEKGRFHLGGTRGSLHSHILIKERAPKVLEAERREVLVHELGHCFGATHSPESTSVMRPVLSGGQLRRLGATIKFDAANTLLMSMMGDEMRRRPIKNLSDISPGARRRMAEIYGALQPLLPDDPAAGNYRRLVAAAGARGLVVDVRKVAERIIQVAKKQSQDSAAESLNGDQLLELYVRQAARAAARLQSGNGARAFVLAMGLSVDDGGLLRRMPTASLAARKFENDRQLERRLDAVGKLTMFGRNDLVQHFFISAYLTASSGTQAARGAGLAKELLDAYGGTGFSFADMAANRAGIVFATSVCSGKTTLEQVADSFEVAAVLPAVADLEEGYDADDFRRHFGAVGDPRFQSEMRRIDRRIRALPFYSSPP